MGWTLRPDVFWCMANGRVVLLDLRADRYLALPEHEDTYFQDLARGVTSPADTAQTFSGLVSAGILIDSPNSLFPKPASLNMPTISYVSEAAHAGLSAGTIEAWLTQWAMERAIKRRDLLGLMQRIRHFKETGQGKAIDLQHADRSLAGFIHSQRLLQAQQHCLRWSLSMVTYLARRRYFPNLVIGVRMMPFAAHAWVQDQARVLSDTVEQVTPYTPILVV